MTAEQQLRSLGISAEAHEGHVIIQTDRTFQMMTPPEIVQFARHLAGALREARAQARGHAYVPRPTAVPA